jgi:hypothetical protein
MATLKDRFPTLFVEVIPPPAVPAKPPAVPPPATKPRVPSAVELVNTIFSTHHISPDNACAIDIIESLKELAKVAPTPLPASVPSAPVPAARPAPVPASVPSSTKFVSPPVPPKAA